MKEIICFENVSKKYQIDDSHFYALDDVSFSIDKGEFIVILGPSGAGKSTILNLLGGMDSCSTGTITINGSDITKYNDKQLTNYRASDIGFVFQFYNILPTLTVLENVEIVKDIVSDYSDSHQVLKSVSLENHLNKFSTQLSGGEQQRVSIARAIAKKPQILLCDEPTGALDSKTGIQIIKILKNICFKTKTTIVIVTHNTSFAQIADKVIHLKNGKIEKIEKIEDKKDIDEVEW